MTIFNRYFDKVETFFLRLSQISVMAMMLLTAVDAISRYFFHNSIGGAYEITERYLMIMLVFLSMSYVKKIDGHIRLDILYEKFSPRLQNSLDIVYNLLAATLMFFIGYEGVIITSNAIVNNLQLSGLYSFPLWLSYIWIPIGSFMIMIRLLLICMHLATNLDKKKESKVGEDEVPL